MTQTEALKLALEALKYTWKLAVNARSAMTLKPETSIKEYLAHMKMIDKAIAKVEEALAQPEQEQCYGHKGKCDRIMPDGKLCQLNAPCPDCGMSLIDYPKPEQEPVAWIRRHPNGALSNEVLIHVQVEPVRRESGAWVPLYTTPPQRTWVGLTDEERTAYINANMSTGLWAMAKEIEAKLKEKNT